MFFDELDEETTKRNADRLLRSFHRIKRLAGAYYPKVTASYSILPRSNTGETSDSTFDAVSRKAEAQSKFDEILKAYNSLSADSRNRIYYKYITEEKLYDYQVYNAQSIGKDTYYRELGIAQLEFAEAYNGGELLFFYPEESD